jgi:hypothetical protein
MNVIVTDWSGSKVVTHCFAKAKDVTGKLRLEKPLTTGKFPKLNSIDSMSSRRTLSMGGPS